MTETTTGQTAGQGTGQGSEPLVCEVCGAAYARRAGEAPLLASQASMAALLTGWDRTTAGRWNCGAQVCQPGASGPALHAV